MYTLEAYSGPAPVIDGSSISTDPDDASRPAGWTIDGFDSHDGRLCTQPAYSGACMFRLRGSGSEKTAMQTLPRAGAAGSAYTLLDTERRQRRIMRRLGCLGEVHPYWWCYR